MKGIGPCHHFNGFQFLGVRCLGSGNVGPSGLEILDSVSDDTICHLFGKLYVSS